MIVPGAGSIGAYLMAFTLRFFSSLSIFDLNAYLPLSVDDLISDNLKRDRCEDDHDGKA